MTLARALLIATGAAAMAYAAVGLLAVPVGAPLFAVALIVVHDAVWMPLVLVTGALITRFVPGRHRAAVRVLLLCAAAFAAVAAPLLISPGRPAGTAPHPAWYAAFALAVVAAAVPFHRRKESERPPDAGSGDPPG